MNQALKKIGHDPIRTPTMVSSETAKGKEVIMMKNLKEEGFQSLDRCQTLCYDHCRLVMKELARYHASAVLYEQRLNQAIEKHHEFKVK